eukprot:gene7181-7987_t
MASKNVGKVVQKLHAVTLVRSRIGRPWWERRTLKALGLRFLNQTIIHKNTPRINGQIEKVKTLVKVTPVVFDEDGLEDLLEKFEAIDLEKLDFSEEIKPVEPFLDTLGRFNIRGFLEYHNNVLTKLPEHKESTDN